MSRLSRKNADLSDQILSILAKAELPLPTLEICELTGSPGYRNYATVLRMLNRLARLELAEKIAPREMRAVYWRIIPQADGLAPERHQARSAGGVPRVVWSR